jgi:ribonuclease BN (tRNA processing enzyme)
MRIRLLPSTFDERGVATSEQHLTCYLVNDFLAVDAGSLALATTTEQKQKIRNIIITHPHLDHIASLPIYIDDLFENLREPICVYATPETIEILEKDIFNWNVYPRFSELSNEYGKIMEFIPISVREEFSIGDLRLKAIPVNHPVQTVGLIISDLRTTVGFSSDTSETDEFWEFLNREPRLRALLIEASFPDELTELAIVSNHLTPKSLFSELKKLRTKDIDILAVHLKPTYREKIIRELKSLSLENLGVMQNNKDYEWH